MQASERRSRTHSSHSDNLTRTTAQGRAGQEREQEVSWESLQRPCLPQSPLSNWQPFCGSRRMFHHNQVLPMANGACGINVNDLIMERCQRGSGEREKGGFPKQAWRITSMSSNHNPNPNPLFAICFGCLKPAKRSGQDKYLKNCARNESCQCQGLPWTRHYIHTIYIYVSIWCHLWSTLDPTWATVDACYRFAKPISDSSRRKTVKKANQKNNTL